MWVRWARLTIVHTIDGLKKKVRHFWHRKKFGTCQKFGMTGKKCQKCLWPPPDLPLPPIRTFCCILRSFSWSMIMMSIYLKVGGLAISRRWLLYIRRSNCLSIKLFGAQTVLRTIWASNILSAGQFEPNILTSAQIVQRWNLWRSNCSVFKLVGGQIVRRSNCATLKLSSAGIVRHSRCSVLELNGARIVRRLNCSALKLSGLELLGTHIYSSTAGPHAMQYIIYKCVV